MKRALMFSVLALACFVVTPLRLSAATTVINPAGKRLSSIFDELKANPTAQTGLTNSPSSANLPKIELISHRLPGVVSNFIIGGGSCPGGEVCSGTFTVIQQAFGGCDVGDGEDCDVHNFAVDQTVGICSQGEQSFYCGVNCCVDARECTNPRSHILCP